MGGLTASSSGQREPAWGAGRADRRRSPRRAFRRSSGVVLEAVFPSGRRRIKGTLLNLSADGLACLVTAEGAQGLVPATRLHAAFRLPDSEDSFELPGRIISVLPAGDGNSQLIGLAFVDGEQEQVRATRETLRSLLGGVSPECTGARQ